ncbi:MAG: hypothetical protein KIT72_04705 [Polyangiaceae bacterium]|nr:hypothetical protein [Polyangiaceae bacterium]MCW5789704.1 hypothetical protein [Polyangiaceae bacterium]
MPRCYFLGVCSGSSLDQGSNNVSLFNLIEQLNLPPGATPPPGGLIPVELHAYWALTPEERGLVFETRFVLVALDSGLELPTEVSRHTYRTPRFRTRMLGLPHPPVVGEYALRVDVRPGDTDAWRRDPAAWPVYVTELQPRESVTVH